MDMLSSLRFKQHYVGFTDSDNTKAPYFHLQNPSDVSLTLLYYMEDASFESKEHHPPPPTPHVLLFLT